MRFPEPSDVGGVQLRLAQCAYRSPVLRPVIHPRMDELRGQMGAVRHRLKPHRMPDIRRLGSSEVHIRHEKVEHRRSRKYGGARLARVDVQDILHAGIGTAPT